MFKTRSFCEVASSEVASEPCDDRLESTHFTDSECLSKLNVMPDLYISWSDYHRNIETLAVSIYRSGWEFDTIVCLAKGGLRVGDIICRLYRKPLAILISASYGGKDNRERGKIRFSEYLATIQPNLTGKILLVDDLVDSGISLKEGIDWLESRYGATISAIKTAVIWYKASSIIVPDYYVDYLKDNPWIHQPFECYESVNIAEFSDRFKNELT